MVRITIPFLTFLAALTSSCGALPFKPRGYAATPGAVLKPKTSKEDELSSPLRSSPLDRALNVRGGGCEFDTSIIAKVTLAHHALFGLASWFTPATMMAQFHPEDKALTENQQLQSLVGRCGTATLSAAVLLYCTVIDKDMDVVKAGGYSLVPWIVNFAYSLLVPEARIVSQLPTWVMVGFLAFASATVYGCITDDAVWGEIWLKTMAGGAIADFLTLTFFTGPTVKTVWQPDRKAAEITRTALQYWRWFGILIGMWGVHLGSLLAGQDAIQSLGNSLLLFVAVRLFDALTNTSDKAPKIKGHLVLVALSVAAIFGCEKGGGGAAIPPPVTA